MGPRIIAIAGGTGSGKSTVCTALQNAYPEVIGLIQLDDYFKPATDAPKLHGMDNFEHPDSLYLDKFVADLKELAKGNSVTINTKNERLNPEYKKTEKRIPIQFHPKPLMLVEGYLVLYDEQIRSLLSESIYLDTHHDIRWRRRVHFKFLEYEEKVLIPMHEKYVEPTKQFADHVINVSDLTKEEVFNKVKSIIKKYLV
jgi:uridine kinase